MIHFDNNIKLKIEVSQFIKKIGSEFDLVMITDHLLESLILLKHALCMSLDDICFFSKNVKTNGPSSIIDDETKELIKEWQHVDAETGYQHTIFQLPPAPQISCLGPLL